VLFTVWVAIRLRLGLGLRRIANSKPLKNC
jgi:hypothetical protein